ncbi:hypothetical protein [Rhodoplanes roseus]|uniref:hypothetical protein n=1 Tax=Rhodoplanes roseus TaxID=29409 RepID=UPI0014749AA8|nr:hypothetical protein [Rhodoplanes roseus]
MSPAGCSRRVRARFVSAARNDRSPSEILIRYAVTLEIEGREKPAMVAEWLIVRRTS